MNKQTFEHGKLPKQTGSNQNHPDSAGNAVGLDMKKVYPSLQEQESSTSISKPETPINILAERNSIMPTKNQFTVIFVNNSSNAGNAAIYQNDPDIGVPNVQSLAWFSKFANPETQAAFGWEVNYSFVWSETGALAPGVHFLAAQDLKADLTNTNQVTLDFNGGYRFLDQESGSIPGNLYVVQNSSIPLRQAAVGIGIGGSPVYAVQSQPNLNLVFSPKSKYFITFGNFQEGEVLDVGSITNPVELQFPPGVFSLTAVLNLDNTFTVIPTSQANTKLLAARKANPQISFSEALAA